MRSRYKAKGRGDTRDIMDGDRLVGRIHREYRRHVREKRAYCGGRLTSVSLSVKSEGYWHATWADSADLVMTSSVGGRVRVERTTIKAWTEPISWGPGRVLPREVTDAE